MKIAVFENLFTEVQGAFTAANLKYFNNELEFSIFPASQKLKPFASLTQYQGVVVDIELAPKSELDGYGLIQKIKTAYPDMPIMVLTGHSKVKEKLKQLDIHDVPVVIKPITFKDLQAGLQTFVSTSVS